MVKSTRKRKHTKRAALYGRRSTDKQKDSLDRQDQELRPYANREAYSVVDVFAETGSGLKEDRPAFQSMIDAAERGAFEYIIVHSQHRFSRFDPIDFNYYLKRLRDAGVQIVTVETGVLNFDDLGSWLKGNVEQHGHNQFSKTIAVNGYSGKVKAALEGRWLTSAPFGFVIDREFNAKGEEIGGTGKLKRGSASDVKKIRKLFALCLAGKTLRELAEWCAENGVRGQRGGRVDHSKVRCILRNPAYVGDYVWGKERTSEIVNYETYTDVFDENGVIFIRDNHARIVDRKTWDRVQRVLDMNAKVRQTSPNRAGRFLLSPKLLRCGECGSWLVGRRQTDTEHVYYRCPNHWVPAKTCETGMQFNELVLIDSIVAALSGEFCTEERLGRIEDHAIQRLTKGRSKLSPKQISKDIAGFETDIAKMRRNLALVDAEYIGDIQAQIADTRRRIDELTRLSESAGLTDDNIQALAREAANDVAGAFSELSSVLRDGDPATASTALREIFEAIEVKGHKGVDKGARQPFARLFKQARSEADLTQYAIEKELGFVYTSPGRAPAPRCNIVSKWERATGLPTEESFEQLRSLINVTPELARAYEYASLRACGKFTLTGLTLHFRKSYLGNKRSLIPQVITYKIAG